MSGRVKAEVQTRDPPRVDPTNAGYILPEARLDDVDEILATSYYSKTPTDVQYTGSTRHNLNPDLKVNADAASGSLGLYNRRPYD